MKIIEIGDICPFCKVGKMAEVSRARTEMQCSQCRKMMITKKGVILG